VRAAVDVMGGDRAPDAILQGCWQAAPLLSGDDVVLLVGDEAVIRAGLESSGLAPEHRERFRVVPTTEVVGMDDSPVEAIRGKPNSSIAVMCKMAAKGEADVVISAGNTGACVAAAQLKMRTLPGVSRRASRSSCRPSTARSSSATSGANITPKPRHFQQYALMAGAYATASAGSRTRASGLLSIGEEDAKGTGLVKDARKLMRTSRRSTSSATSRAATCSRASSTSSCATGSSATSS
jgi:glycerol-3-phosphate acyltransferase PlsX